MTAGLAVLYALIQNSYQVVDAGAVDNHQILNEKAIGWIPPAMQDSRIGVEEISDLLIINFRERCLDRVLLCSFLRDLPE